MAPVVAHTFVLADLFEVVSMTLIVPDHVLESDPALVWVACSECYGEGLARVLRFGVGRRL